MLLAIDSKASAVWIISPCDGRFLVERVGRFGAEWLDHTFKTLEAATRAASFSAGSPLTFTA